MLRHTISVTCAPVICFRGIGQFLPSPIRLTMRRLPEESRPGQSAFTQFSAATTVGKFLHGLDLSAQPGPAWRRRLASALSFLGLTLDYDISNMTQPLLLSSRYGRPIRTMDEWRDERKAVNVGWVPGKSAWEIAHAWVGIGVGEPLVPSSLQELLNSHRLTAGMILDDGVVELKTRLRCGAAGPRNHDLALWARKKHPTAFIGVESKANDGFGETMQQQMDNARRLRLQPKNTNLDHRVDWLSECLLGRTLAAGCPQIAPRDPKEEEIRTKVLQLPYQLFAGVAGTLLEAKKARSEIAIFVVHQFRTAYTNDHDIRADAKRLYRFASLLLQANSSPDGQPDVKVPLRCEMFVGPIYLKHRDFGKWTMPTQIPFLIGEIQTDRMLSQATI